MDVKGLKYNAEPAEARAPHIQRIMQILDEAEKLSQHVADKAELLCGAGIRVSGWQSADGGEPASKLEAIEARAGSVLNQLHRIDAALKVAGA